MPQHDDQNAFLSVLSELDRPGQAVRNLLSGKPMGALRHVGQGVLNAIDAILPGDWLPNDVAEDEDYISGGDLVGVKEPGIGKFLADVGVGMATDPLSFLTGGASGAAATAGRAALKVGIPFTKIAAEIPGTARAIGGITDAAKAGIATARTKPVLGKLVEAGEDGGRLLRRAAGEQRMRPELRAVSDAAHNSGVGDKAAGLAATKKAFEGLSEGEQEIVGDILDNKLWENGRTRNMQDGADETVLGAERVPGALGRVDIHPAVTPENRDRIRRAVQGSVEIGLNQKMRPGIFHDHGVMSDEYLMRQWTGQTEEQAINEVLGGGRPSQGGTASLKELKLETPEQINAHLEANPGVKYERNALKRMSGRAEQQGVLGTRADIGKGVLDLARKGVIDIPEDVLRDYAARIPGFDAPIPPSGTAATQDLTGVLRPMERDPYGLGSVTGKASPPTPGVPADLDIRPLIDDPYGLGVQSGKSKPPGMAPVGKPETLADYGLDPISGVSKPPKSGTSSIFQEVPGGPVPADPSRLTAQSGKALPPKSGTPSQFEIDPQKSFLEDASRLNEQSGRVKVPPNPKPRQFTPEQMGQAKEMILGKEYQHADPAMRSVVENTIKFLPAEEAQVLLDQFRGMPARNGFEKILNWNNGFFKKAAVYGAFIPKFGSIVRNKVSGVWQSLANPEARGVLPLGQAKRFVSDLSDAMTQSLNLTSLRMGELSNATEAIDAALSASKGSFTAAQDILRSVDPKLADALKHNVGEGYATAEELTKEMGRTKWSRRFHNIMNWPGRVFQGVEARMRLGAYLDLMNKTGMPSEQAARITADTFFSYRTTSREQRFASDLIPFWKFQSKASVQSAKFIAEKPLVGVGLAQALQHDDSAPIYPWMEGKTNIPLGQDQEGNNQYATSLGLPFEALNQIPTTAREFKKNVVGSSNPLIKSSLARIFGQDPYFETPFGTYDKLPGNIPAGAVGRAYNQVAGTGMIQPLDSVLRSVGGIVDSRPNAGVKTLNLLTGVNIASVDPNLARQKQLQQTLLDNPDVEQHRSLYTRSADPETKQLLMEYKDAQKQAREKRRGQLVQ